MARPYWFSLPVFVHAVHRLDACDGVGLCCAFRGTEREFELELELHTFRARFSDESFSRSSSPTDRDSSRYPAGRSVSRERQDPPIRFPDSFPESEFASTYRTFFPSPQSSVPFTTRFRTQRASTSASNEYEETSEFNDAFALGLLIAGCMPGGSTSNLFCYYANGDVGLSIMMTLASTSLAFVMVPVVLLVYSPSFTSEAIKINYAAIMASLLLVLVPASLGILVRNWDHVGRRGADHAGEAGPGAGPESAAASSEQAREVVDFGEAMPAVPDVPAAPSPAVDHCDGDVVLPLHERIANCLERLAAQAGAVFIAAALVFGLIKHVEFFTKTWTAWLAAGLLAPLGLIFGHVFGGLALDKIIRNDLGASSRQKVLRTITLETGVQNSTLAVAIITATWAADEDETLRNDLMVTPLMYAGVVILEVLLLVLVWRKLDQWRGAPPLEDAAEATSAGKATVSAGKPAIAASPSAEQKPVF